MLAEQSRRVPNVVIEERNIAEGPSALLNETLSTRFRVKDNLHQATPAIFTQAGVLIRDEITFPRVGVLLRQAAAAAPDQTWREAGVNDLKVAETVIVKRYDSLALGVVLFSG